jgi:23S rRNA (cytosine1962-C5)-methyltransferase
MVARLRLVRPLERAVSMGHPWLYAEALERARDLAVGTEVQLQTRNGRPLAVGLYDPTSPLAVRVYSLDPKERIDAAFVRRRLHAALLLRLPRFDRAQTDCFRLCNGEGDRLPGIVVDLYADVAIVRFDGAASRTLLDGVVRALREIAELEKLPLRCIYERSRGGVGAALVGDAPTEPVRVREHGVTFLVDVLRGQKTGFFLDQRENRRRLRTLSSKKRVANLFSYTGGFSVNAALGGAPQVTSVDVAEPAIVAARAHFSENGLDPAAHVFAAVDAFEWLESERKRGERYDLIVTDPPSFAPSERALPAALAAYRDLNALALTLIPDGGLLCAASCSSHVDLPAFLGTLAEAGRIARRPLTVLETHGQPLDHPSPPAFAEGRYLKFVICAVG